MTGVSSVIKHTQCAIKCHSGYVAVQNGEHGSEIVHFIQKSNGNGGTDSNGVCFLILAAAENGVVRCSNLQLHTLVLCSVV